METQHPKLENSTLGFILFMRDNDRCDIPHAADPLVEVYFQGKLIEIYIHIEENFFNKAIESTRM